MIGSESRGRVIRSSRCQACCFLITVRFRWCVIQGHSGPGGGWSLVAAASQEHRCHPEVPSARRMLIAPKSGVLSKQSEPRQCAPSASNMPRFPDSTLSDILCCESTARICYCAVHREGGCSRPWLAGDSSSSHRHGTGAGAPAPHVGDAGGAPSCSSRGHWRSRPADAMRLSLHGGAVRSLTGDGFIA